MDLDQPLDYSKLSAVELKALSIACQNMRKGIDCNNRFNAANSLLVAGAEKLLACQAKFSNSAHVLIALALNFPDNSKRIFSDDP